MSKDPASLPLLPFSHTSSACMKIHRDKTTNQSRVFQKERCPLKDTGIPTLHRGFYGEKMTLENKEEDEDVIAVSDQDALLSSQLRLHGRVSVATKPKNLQEDVHYLTAILADRGEKAAEEKKEERAEFSQRTCMPEAFRSFFQIVSSYTHPNFRTELMQKMIRVIPVEEQDSVIQTIAARQTYLINTFFRGEVFVKSIAHEEETAVFLVQSENFIQGQIDRNLICLYEKLRDIWPDLPDVLYLKQRDAMANHARSVLRDNEKRLKKLKKLDLSRAMLTGITYEMTSLLPNLQELILDGNKIPAIPPWISRWTSLRKLSLAHNVISHVAYNMKSLSLIALYLNDNPLKSIPRCIYQMSKLKILVLSSTQLEIIPADIEMLQRLEHFEISNNRIRVLPNEIGNLSRLRIFSAQNNELYSLPIKFVKLVSLEAVFLDGNNFTSFPRVLCFLGTKEKICSVAELSQLFDEHSFKARKVKKLKRLGMSYNQIIEIEAHVLAYFANLRILDLSHNKFVQGDLNCPSLRHLDLSHNKMITLPYSLLSLKLLQTFIVEGNSFEKLPEIFISQAAPKAISCHPIVWEKAGEKGDPPPPVTYRCVLGSFVCCKRSV